MSTNPAEQQFRHIGAEKVLALVRSMLGRSRGREDDEHPLPPGPWGPVIRIALEQMASFGPQPEPWTVFGRAPQPWLMRDRAFGPRPEPWKLALAQLLAKHPEIFDALGGGHGFSAEAALNPQPLPPRFAFLVAVARAVMSRAELLQEVADATSRQGEQQKSIIVGGYARRFSDDVCGNDFRWSWPFPWPRPNWLAAEIDGIDLLVLATQFEQASKEAFSADLRHDLADVSAQLLSAGISKLR